jgi:glyoxylase-like metal-dependent hydrolase (beta-lactamase superfamily II)
MEVNTITVGLYGTNCYIVFDGEKGEAAVIDPGAQADEIIRFLSSNSLKVKNIFLTHGHFDHILGVQQLKSYTGARVVIHEADAQCLENAHEALYSSILHEPFRVSKADILLKGGEKTLVGSVEAEFIHTPGHTNGSMCIMMDNVIFSGDTLFAGDVGRTDLRGGDPESMKHSLRLLYMLPHDYIVYPGHGAPTSLGIERDTNEYLRASGAR